MKTFLIRNWKVQLRNCRRGAGNARLTEEQMKAIGGGVVANGLITQSFQILDNPYV